MKICQLCTRWASAYAGTWETTNLGVCTLLSKLNKKTNNNRMNEIQFILYQLPDENGKVQVVIKDETIWTTQKAMAQLFGVGVSIFAFMPSDCAPAG